jgi:hypothetical protein
MLAEREATAQLYHGPLYSLAETCTRPLMEHDPPL